MEWPQVKNLLCIRADNMGDVLMTAPSLQALKKQNPKRKITLLTSSSGAEIAQYIPEIDEVLVSNLPWVKVNEALDSQEVLKLISELKNKQFDGSIIFSNFSQNSLPAALLCYLAGIPKRLGYCRENPYSLLTDWIPDKEPFFRIRHGVKRQLFLVSKIGVKADGTKLSLRILPKSENSLSEKLKRTGVDLNKPWIVVHVGVSETKRRYSDDLLIKACRNLGNSFQIVLTGLKNDQPLAGKVLKSSKKAVSLVGKLKLDELIALVSQAPILVSGNTGPVHIASVLNIPVVVLYAQTNPEHTPWGIKKEVLYFSVPKNQRSKNQVLEYIAPKGKRVISPEDITQAVLRMCKK